MSQRTVTAALYRVKPVFIPQRRNPDAFSLQFPSARSRLFILLQDTVKLFFIQFYYVRRMKPS